MKREKGRAFRDGPWTTGYVISMEGVADAVPRGQGGARCALALGRGDRRMRLLVQSRSVSLTSGLVWLWEVTTLEGLNRPGLLVCHAAWHGARLGGGLYE